MSVEDDGVPGRHHGNGVAKWCNELEVDVLVLPSYYLRAKLIDRLHGNTFALVSEDVRSRIVVYDETGGVNVY